MPTPAARSHHTHSLTHIAAKPAAGGPGEKACSGSPRSKMSRLGAGHKAALEARRRAWRSLDLRELLSASLLARNRARPSTPLPSFTSLPSLLSCLFRVLKHGRSASPSVCLPFGAHAVRAERRALCCRLLLPPWRGLTPFPDFFRRPRGSSCGSSRSAPRAAAVRALGCRAPPRAGPCPNPNARAIARTSHGGKTLAVCGNLTIV